MKSMTSVHADLMILIEHSIHQYNTPALLVRLLLHLSVWIELRLALRILPAKPEEKKKGGIRERKENKAGKKRRRERNKIREDK